MVEMDTLDQRRRAVVPVLRWLVVIRAGGLMAIILAVAWSIAGPPVLPDPASSVIIEIRDGERRSGHGSGNLLGDGFILTARHVARGEGTLSLVDRSGARHPAQVWWEHSSLDLAVLFAPTVEGPGVGISCRAPHLGEPLVTIGHPGNFEWRMTFGHVVDEAAFLAVGGEDWWTFGADFAIEAGASGSAVFDERGRVVGVMSALRSIALPFGSMEKPGWWVTPVHLLCREPWARP